MGRRLMPFPFKLPLKIILSNPPPGLIFPFNLLAAAIWTRGMGGGRREEEEVVVDESSPHPAPIIGWPCSAPICPPNPFPGLNLSRRRARLTEIWLKRDFKLNAFLAFLAPAFGDRIAATSISAILEPIAGNVQKQLFQMQSIRGVDEGGDQGIDNLEKSKNEQLIGGMGV